MIKINNIPSKAISNNLLIFLKKEILELNSINSLDQISNIDFSYENSEIIRQKIFEYFRSNSGKSLYIDLILEIAKKLNLKDYYVQKVPTVRVHLCNRGITSFHSDSWYGHHPKAISVWVPLTDVHSSNSLHFVDKKINNLQIINLFNSKKEPLCGIDEYLRNISKPTKIELGDAIYFYGDEIHGTVKNETGATRVSFDFRISASLDMLGNKPPTNYWKFGENTKNIKNLSQRSSSTEVKNVASYSTDIKNIPAKVQILTASFTSSDEGLNIIRNESEILTLDYMPVLTDLINDDTLDGVIIYSFDIFKNNEIKEFFLKELKKNHKFFFISSELKFCYGK